MAHQNDKHLTTEQLSALLDKQLFQGEQPGWNAHLRVCQQCQARLADLRRTVGLLHALPQAELPRSFVLPASTTPAPERPVRQVARVSEPRALITPIPRAQRRGHPILRRSVRAMSTLAAVIGFILIMSGFLANVHIGGGAATFAPNPASSGASITANHNALTPASAKQPDQTAGAYPPTKGVEKPGASTPQVAPTPTETLGSAQSHASVQNQNSPLPSALDLSTSMGQEGVGFILLVLGILGLIFTRMIRRRAEGV